MPCHAGETVKLKDLLDEAVRRCGDDMASRRSESDAAPSDGGGGGGAAGGDDDAADAAAMEAAYAHAARVVGIGAVKYADLSMNRESNYRFSYAKMLSLNGNTAPYMLYAYARIRGIQVRSVGRSEGLPWSIN